MRLIGLWSSWRSIVDAQAARIMPLVLSFRNFLPYLALPPRPAPRTARQVEITPVFEGCVFGMRRGDNESSRDWLARPSSQAANRQGLVVLVELVRDGVALGAGRMVLRQVADEKSGNLLRSEPPG